MTCRDDLADYEWLAGPEAEPVLRDLADRTAAGGEPIHATAHRLRHQFSAERAHLLLEQVELRQRAAAKFARPERMFFTRRGLEQATDQWVAKYKAERFADRGPLADLCCGIGGDLLALANYGPTVGVDCDPIATCFATANARVMLSSDFAKRVSLQTREIEHADVRDCAAWHIDPDRRPAGNRTSSLAWSSPNGDVIDELLAAVPHAAVKLAPAADAPTPWVDRCELEWISRDRQCRQLVAWHGDLAHAPGQRRATVLTSQGWLGSSLSEPPVARAQARTVLGQPNELLPIAGQLAPYLFEPDPAVLAAELTGALAAEHGLSAVSPGIAYLTGVQPLADPALACFAVEEILPLKLRSLARHFRARGIGRLEIKKRGVEHDPAQVRRALKLQGEKAATLILTKLNGKHVAIVARRTTQTEAAESLTPDPQPPAPRHAACL